VLKRVFTLLLLVLVAFAVGQDELAARQADADNPFWNPSEATLESWRVVEGVEEGAEIRWWTMSLSPTFNEYLEQIVANFEATYPGVTVVWEDVPWDGLQARTRNSFTAGDPPDVINLSPSWLGEFAGAGLLMDMDDAIAAYGDVRDNYVDTAWNTATYEGTSYQVPWYLALTNFVGYNEAVLAECGVAAADLPTTWTDLRSFAQTTQDSCGLYATSLNFGPATEQYLLDYLAYNDIPLKDEDGNAIFNTPEAAAALQVWVDLVQEGLVPRSSLTDDHRNMIDRFSEGETALVMIAPHLLRLVEENNPDTYASLGIAPGITGSSGKNRVDVQSLVIAADTEAPNAALALTLFITNPETQAEFSKWAGVFPSNLASYDDPYFSTTEGGQLPALRPLAFDYVSNADNRTALFPNNTEVEQAVSEATQSALLGQQTPQEALDDLVARINDIIDQ
jgi:putative chitobiose transport system substrate-binding protein